MLLTVIGARPQFIKAASVSRAFIEWEINETIVHTGQHYDDQMSDVFFNELSIPRPSINLNVGSGLHGKQTADIIIGIEDYILGLSTPPKAVLLYGDTNSTIAGAIVAAKLNIPIIHVEAGLRSFDKTMPEEVNRIVTDHLSDLLFCSSEAAIGQLEREGIKNNVYNVGDVMYDSFKIFSKFQSIAITWPLKQGEDFSLLTLHRPTNTDNLKILNEIIKAISQIENKVIWPMHPRITKIKGQLVLPENLIIIEPLSYFEMLWALNSCKNVITDSGGLQKEAYWARKTCFTVRESTEWIETIDGGWNSLVKPEELVERMKVKPTLPWKELYGDGNASNKIAQKIKEKYQ